MNEWKITDISGCLFGKFKGSLDEAIQRAEYIARDKGTGYVVRDRYNRLAAVPDSHGNLVPMKSEKWRIESRSGNFVEYFTGTLTEALERADEAAHHLGQNEKGIEVYDAYGTIAAMRYRCHGMENIALHEDPIRCCGDSGFYSDWLHNKRLIQNNGDGTYTTISSYGDSLSGETVDEWVDSLLDDRTLFPKDYIGKTVTPDMPDYVVTDNDMKVWHDRLIID